MKAPVHPHPPPRPPTQAVSVRQTWPPPKRQQLGRPPSSTHGNRRAASGMPQRRREGRTTRRRRTALTQVTAGRGEHVSRGGAARGRWPPAASDAAPRTASRGRTPRPMDDCTERAGARRPATHPARWWCVDPLCVSHRGGTQQTAAVAVLACRHGHNGRRHAVPPTERK